MSNIILRKKEFITDCTIQLTGSKSESNRALILSALSDGLVRIENLSSAADTVTLNEILQSYKTKDIVDVGPAGTAMRFLTAFFAIKSSGLQITGSERMKQRPIGILVDALKKLGADISYQEKDNYPPLQIGGNFLQQANHINIKGNISSQYITAMLLIANSLTYGLNIIIDEELTSKPYVEMTLAMLNQCGIKHQWIENKIKISPQTFLPTTLIIEPDWSAASYWYSIVAFAENATIILPHLKKHSLQGDSVITSLMENFGVSSTFDNEGLTIVKKPINLNSKLYDLKKCPDLAQTLIVCCAALGINASFTGLETLKIKETDRIQALKNELSKINIKLVEYEYDIYTLDCSNKSFPDKIFIKTYDDHRMAMAFAPLAMFIKEVEIEDAEVVQKSYPHFWDDFKKLGFEIITN